jgi:hypothetical protein
MSKPNKTRAIRLSDEAWNELKRRANEQNLRGRAEYLEMLCKEDEDRTAEGWWLANPNITPIKPDLSSVSDLMNYGNAYFDADTGFPIKASSIKPT